MRGMVGLLAVVACAAAPALADWNVGDPHKMHFPQLPDQYGIDVNFRSPIVLADDWKCSETGPVTDIHFWFSAQNDWFDISQPLTSQIFNIHTSIHGDIPADPGDPTSYSRPIDPAYWERDFAPTQPEVKIRRWLPDGDQAWYDPTIPMFVPADHFKIYQVNITGIPNPFTQQQGTIYWLDLSISSVQPLGWKTADTAKYPAPYTGKHYLDDAVWRAPGAAWTPLYDPRDPAQHVSLDLAFVITPEPAAALLLLAGALCVRRRS